MRGPTHQGEAYAHDGRSQHGPDAGHLDAESNDEHDVGLLSQGVCTSFSGGTPLNESLRHPRARIHRSFAFPLSPFTED